MKYRDLRERVCAANKEINRIQLAILTWGNASEIDREAGVFAIKPSGMDYEALTPADIPIVSLATGASVDSKRNPSSDTATHLHLYRAFPEVGGIVHTHSAHATAWAQAQREIPCLGTTHADTFYGAVPCTRPLNQTEIVNDYELHTGKVIEEHFTTHHLRPMEIPGVLVAAHGPFAWGMDAMNAVTHGRILEAIAQMAAITLAISPHAVAVAPYLLDKHYLRKHGENAYYGQREEGAK